LNVKGTGDAAACYTGNSAVSLYNYIYGVALVTRNANQNTAAAATVNFLNTVGNKLNAASADVVQCVEASQDFQNAVAALGEDPLSAGVATAVANDLVNDAEGYLYAFNSVYNALAAGNFESAGRILAIYQKTLAAPATA